jgi:hypothetical protein
MAESLDQQFEAALKQAERQYVGYLESADLARLTSVAVATLNSSQKSTTTATAATFTFGPTPS